MPAPYFENVRYGLTKPGLNLTQVSECLIPLPPLKEQQEITDRVTDIFSQIDALEAWCETELKRSNTLRQSILKSAFSGQLAPQDATDEPASELLKRIQAERTTSKPAKKTKKKKQKSAVNSAEIIPFPHTISSITTTDLHAGIIGLAYNQHEQHPRTLGTFGHVKAEKIAHLVEYHVGIGLGRTPVKDAAGPNDYRHLKQVEHRADKANWFNVQRRSGGEGYTFVKKRGFDALLTKVSDALGERAEEVQNLIRLLLPLNTQQAEIVATLYAAWNNLLLSGEASPSDEEIVTEARENWHSSKLQIERDRFFRGLEWLKKKNLIPHGIGKLVVKKEAS